MKTDYLDSEFDLDSPELVEVFDETPLWSAPFGIELLETIRYRKNITALDIGFGTGFPLTEVAMRLGISSRVFGIDPWQACINRAKKKLDIYGIRNTSIINGVAEQVPLSGGSIDLVVSNNGINNASDMAAAISECSRIMKPGGQFVQSMNLKETMIEFYEVFEKVLMESGFDDSVQKLKQHINEKRKPLEYVIELLESHSFTSRDIRHCQFFYRFTDGTTFFHHYFIRLAFLDPWKQIVPAPEQKETFHKVEHRINNISRENGSFSLSVPFVIIDAEKQ